MRKIDKHEPIDSFNKMMSSIRKPHSWDDMHSSKRNKAVFHEMREYICIMEQNCLCGYTEFPIGSIDNCHIDHYRKKDLFVEDTFNWKNLIVATKDDSFGANYKDKKYKIKKNEYANILNPTIDICQDYFEYNQLGQICAKQGLTDQETEKCNKTITVFNLNHESLVRRRKCLAIKIKYYKDSCFSSDDILDNLKAGGFISAITHYVNI